MSFAIKDDVCPFHKVKIHLGNTISLTVMLPKISRFTNIYSSRHFASCMFPEWTIMFFYSLYGNKEHVYLSCKVIFLQLMLWEQ